MYEEPAASDGARVLVDRLWPRGVSKESAHLTEWLRDVAPSDVLRTWYGHAPERFAEFSSRYLAELRTGTQHEALGKLRELTQKGQVTLLTATRDVEHSQAAVLAKLLTA